MKSGEGNRFIQFRLLHQVPRALRDLEGLIRDPFEIGAKLHRRDNLPQIRSDWLEAQQDHDPVVVDFHFQGIDFFFIRNCCSAELGVTIEQAGHCVLQISIR